MSTSRTWLVSLWSSLFTSLLDVLLPVCNHINKHNTMAYLKIFEQAMITRTLDDGSFSHPWFLDVILVFSIFRKTRFYKEMGALHRKNYFLSPNVSIKLEQQSRFRSKTIYAKSHTRTAQETLYNSFCFTLCLVRPPTGGVLFSGS